MRKRRVFLVPYLVRNKQQRRRTKRKRTKSLRPRRSSNRTTFLIKLQKDREQDRVDLPWADSKEDHPHKVNKDRGRLMDNILLLTDSSRGNNQLDNLPLLDNTEINTVAVPMVLRHPINSGSSNNHQVDNCNPTLLRNQKLEA